MIRLYTFGGLRIERDGQPVRLPTHKTRDLLAYLITFRGRPHPRLVLAGVLWPDLPEEKARRRLSDALWRLRRALSECVTADDKTIGLCTGPSCWLDVEEFVARSRPQAHLIQGDGSETTKGPLIAHLRDAIALYQGPFLEGLYHDWVLLERERLHGLYLEVLGQLLKLYKQATDYENALLIAQRLVAAEPLHEAAHRELMRLYHLLGRDAEAVAQYHRCREVLRKELDVAPAPETEALYHTLSRRSPSPPQTSTTYVPTPVYRPLVDLDELPLVGRDAERSALLGHLEAAISGRGGIVLIEGEPGIGKSRLARELIAGARWRNVNAVLAGADGTALPSFGLFLAALSPLLTPLRIRQLARLVPPLHLRAAALLLPSISQTLPDVLPLSDLPPPQARERLQQALVVITLGLSRIAPHLWVLEDVQWADPETLSLLPLLALHLKESRILILLTGRSAELRSRPAVWDSLQALDRAIPFPRYTLTRLDTAAVRSLVSDLLGKDDPDLADYLMRESEGVPLYLVEILKAWRDEGYLQPTRWGTWEWQGEPPSGPPSFLGETVIERRLARLSPAANEVLAVAAAIGTEVDFDLLSSAYILSASPPAPDAPDRYLLAIDELLCLGFLVETDTGYRFSHDRVRQAIYRRLPLSRRQSLHRSIAQALEILFPDQFELLAHHFAAAGERQPTIHYLLRAVKRAQEVFAHDAALEGYGQLLDLLTRPEDRPLRCDVLRDRARVLGWIGDREAQGRDLGEMLRLARALSDDARIAAALQLRSEWHRVQGHYEQANADAMAALEIYDRLGDKHAQAALLSQLGWNVVYTANHPQAADYFRRALSIYESLDDLQGQIHCLSGLMSAAELGGDYSRSMFYSERCMALAEALGDPHCISDALLGVGVRNYDFGDLESARTHLRKALRISEAIGERRYQAAIHYYLGEVACEGRDFETAHHHLNAALEIFREVQDLSWEGDALAGLGRLALLQGQPTVASERLMAAYQRRQELNEPGYAVIDLSYLALAELALGDEGAAWQHSREAVAQLEAGLTGVEHPYRIYYNHFRVAEATHHWAAARAALEKAATVLAEWTERIGDPDLRERFRTAHHVRRAIIEAQAAQPPPGRLLVRLPPADAPGRGRGAPEATVPVVWTVDAEEEDEAILAQEGKVALRRHRILRLLAEAEAAGALPTVADLAGALDVSPRTIRADLAALRRQGHPARTCGSCPR